MEEQSGQVWVNRKKARRSLTVDPFAYAQHLLREPELVFFAANMLNGRIRKCQVEGLIFERHRAARTLNVFEPLCLLGNLDVDDGDSLTTPNDRPGIVLPANIQNFPARLILGNKASKSPSAEVFPHRHLEINGLHALEIFYMKRFGLRASC